MNLISDKASRWSRLSAFVAVLSSLVVGVTLPTPPRIVAQTQYAYYLPSLMLSRPIAFASNRDGNYYHDLYLMQADGSSVIRVPGPDSVDCPTWSPNGWSLVYVSYFTNHIHLINSDGTGLTQLTAGSRREGSPSWSPDGKYLAFAATDWVVSGIYVMQPGQSGEAVLIESEAPDDYWGPRWSPDGRQIALVSDFEGDIEIYMSDITITSTSIKLAEPLVRLTNSPWTDTDPNWSPDGSHIVFVSERDGNSEIWTMRADGSDAVRLTDNAWAEAMPVWSPDGKQILYTTDRDGSVELFIMNADGSNQVNLTNSPYWEGCASWR